MLEGPTMDNFAAPAALAAVVAVLCGVFFPEETLLSDDAEIRDIMMGRLASALGVIHDRLQLAMFLVNDRNRWHTERPRMIIRFQQLYRRARNNDYELYFIEEQAMSFLRSPPQIPPIVSSNIHSQINGIIEAVTWLYNGP